jgi:hypothetical protein
MYSRRLHFSLLGSVLICAFAFSIISAEAQSIYNVKSFGAKGNGHDDDTSAIKNALSAAGAYPGSTVFFPPGNYLFGGVLHADSINISGRNAKLTATSSQTSSNIASEVEPDVPDGAAALIIEGAGGSVENMAFDRVAPVDFLLLGSPSTPNGGIFARFNDFNIASSIVLNNGFNSVISQNKFTVADSETAITLNNSNGVSITQNSFDFPLYILSANAPQQNMVASSARSSGVAIRASGVTRLSLLLDTIRNIENVLLFDSVNSFEILNNKISNYGTLEFDNSQNGVVRQNHLSGATGNGITLHADTNVLVEQNVIAGAGTGTGICFTADSTDAGSNRVTYNNISRFDRGVFASGQQNLSIDQNTISLCQAQGIEEHACKGTDTITNNVLSNCGLKSSSLPAVIFVDDEDATSIPITGNFYSGKTNNLQYFIWCKDTQPPANVAGNKTNTLLPNRIGS